MSRDRGDVADRISPFAAADTAALQRNCKKQGSRPAFPSRTPGGMKVLGIVLERADRAITVLCFMSLFTLKTRDQSQYGPVEMETLHGWVREGRVLPEDQIYDHVGMKWVTASQMASIAELLKEQPSVAPVPAASVDPLAKTQYEDPLTRMEREVATEIQSSKKTTGRQATAKPPASMQRLSRELVRTDDPSPAAGPNKPPTVLERITRILISPFARRRSDGDKKESQRVK